MSGVVQISYKNRMAFMAEMVISKVWELALVLSLDYT